MAAAVVSAVPPALVSTTRLPLSDVAPVPPFATARVPPSVIVPDAVIGPPVAVKPVVPPLTSTLVTVPPVAPGAAMVKEPAPGVSVMPVPAVSDAATGAPPVLPSSTWPSVSAAASTIAPALLTMMRSLFNAAALFVPPYPMCNGPPPIVMTPLVVTGPPVKVRPVKPPLTSTEVTLPAELPTGMYR